MHFKWTRARPLATTFDIYPIKLLVKQYLRRSKVSIDPFARDKRWATYTNDLNPDTLAEYHMDVLDFLKSFRNDGVRVDLALFDPPFSPRQMKEVYESIGLTMTHYDTRRTAGWTKERNVLAALVEVGGFVISFGWNSVGMGRQRGFEPVEGVLICHGAGHNDTIVLVERKIREQAHLYQSDTHAPEHDG